MFNLWNNRGCLPFIFLRVPCLYIEILNNSEED